MLKFFNLNRSFSTTTLKFVKEIKATKIDNKIIVEGVILEKSNKPNYKHNNRFSLRSLGVRIDYSDVLILRQFLNKDGSILSMNVTGLNMRDQLRIELLVERSKRAGLLPITITEEGKHVYFDGGPNKFNVYYNKQIVGIPTRKKLIPPVVLND